MADVKIDFTHTDGMDRDDLRLEGVVLEIKARAECPRCKLQFGGVRLYTKWDLEEERSPPPRDGGLTKQIEKAMAAHKCGA